MTGRILHRIRHNCIATFGKGLVIAYAAEDRVRLGEVVLHVGDGQERWHCDGEPRLREHLLLIDAGQMLPRVAPYVTCR